MGWVWTFLISCLLWIIRLLFTCKLCPLGVRIFLSCGKILINILLNGCSNKFFIVLLLSLCLFLDLWFILIWTTVEIISIIFILFCFIFTFQSVRAYNSPVALVSFEKISFRNWWSPHLLVLWGGLWLCNNASTSVFSLRYFLLKQFLKCFRLFNYRNIIY